MSIYGELGDEFRPRPAWWRIAVVSLGQFVLATVLTSLLLAIIDGVLLIQSGIARALIIKIAPPKPGFDAQHAVTAVCLLIIAEIVLDFLPMPRTLAMRHFAIVLAQALAAFGAGVLAMRQPVVAAIPIALAAAAVIWRAERAATRTFNNVMDATRPGRRALMWLLRIGPVCAIGVGQPILPVLSGEAILPVRTGGIACPTFLGVVTLLATLARKPRDEYEETLEPEMREAAAVLPIVCALVVAAVLWLTPRVIVITTRGPSIRPWKPIESDLAKRLRDRQARR